MMGYHVNGKNLAVGRLMVRGKNADRRLKYIHVGPKGTTVFTPQMVARVSLPGHESYHQPYGSAVVPQAQIDALPKTPPESEASVELPEGETAITGPDFIVPQIEKCLPEPEYQTGVFTCNGDLLRKLLTVACEVSKDSDKTIRLRICEGLNSLRIDTYRQPGDQEFVGVLKGLEYDGEYIPGEKPNGKAREEATAGRDAAQGVHGSEVQMRKSIPVFLILVATAFGRRHPDTRVFVPSIEAVVAQTRVIEEFKLRRVKTDAELHVLVQSGELVLLCAPGLRIDPRLSANRRYVLPQTREVISALAAEFAARFDAPLTVTSAVRPESVQRRLLRWNRNAAPVNGERASSHMTGATVDITRRGMSSSQVKWMEDALLNLAIRNRVIVLEEKRQPCFHIFVIPRAR